MKNLAELEHLLPVRDSLEKFQNSFYTGSYTLNKMCGYTLPKKVEKDLQKALLAYDILYAVLPRTQKH